MLRKLLVLAAPLLLVLLVEAAFECGIWEPLAEPASHAGTSVRLKRALLDPASARIDYVTIGSSRPEYGLDHALLAATARRSGYVHADLTMPGTHWMTVGVLSRWLSREHPEIRGGIIALSIQDLLYPGNGAYELGIVQPFRRLADIPWIRSHVPFELSDVSSYATYSALFGWRSDIQEYLRHPQDREQTIEWFAANRGTAATLFGDPDSHGDMCSHGLDSLSACDGIEASSETADDGLKRQCKELRANAAGRAQTDAAIRQPVPPEPLQRTRDLVRRQLREMRWPVPPLVVLMPVPRVWTKDVLPAAQHEWALSILRPLADEGRIGLIDATDFFAGEGADECGAFFDFYHQNASGRDRFTRWLLPQIAARFGYALPAPPGAP